MLENMRRQGASIFIYFIFGILILVFIINFRPGGQRGDDAGCTGTSNTTITVDGDNVNATSYKVNYGAYNGPQMQRTFRALENLIRREILVGEAASHGILASDDLILDKIKQGFFFLAGQAEVIKDLFREDGTWDYERYKGFVQNQFNVSLTSYQDEQRRELQAALMAQEIADSVRVSRDEAYESYLYDNNTVTFDAVVFHTDAYRAALHATDADIDGYVKDHDAEVKARYQADATLYKGVKPQLKLREIFIAKATAQEAPKPPTPDDAQGSGAKAPDKGDKDKGDKDKGADKKSDKKSDKKTADTKPATPAPVGMPIEEAKAKLEAARAAIVGGKSFADVARELDTDPALRASGGDLGWRAADSAAIGDKPVTDAIKDLKPGAGTNLTKVIATDKGVYLVIAEDKREGDLSYDQVKHEIGATLAKDAWVKEAAKRAAVAALDAARAGHKNLDQMFERDANDELPPDLKQILKANPTMTREQLMEEIRKFRQQQAPGGEGEPPPPPDEPHGALEIDRKPRPRRGAQQREALRSFEGPDHPAGWFADSDGTPSTPPSDTFPADSPTPTPTPTGSAAAVGSAGSAAAAGSAADLVAVTTDKLPAFDPVPPPKVSEEGPMTHLAKATGLGGKDIVVALFDELAPGDLGKRIYAGDGDTYVLIQLKGRNQASVTDFDKQADKLMLDLRKRRADAAVSDYLKARCEALAKANKIRPNTDLVREHDENGNPLPSSYHPCMSFRPAAPTAVGE